MTGLRGDDRRPAESGRAAEQPVTAARCPVLVGRELEAAVLARALRGLVQGTGSVTVVMGEAGIGKTGLTEQAAHLAREAGARVTGGRAAAEFWASPYRPLSEALLVAARDHPAPAPDALRPYVAVLAWLVPHWREPGWR